MRTYFTFRPLEIGTTLLTPSEVIERRFAGLDIRYGVVPGCWDQEKDGRILAWFEVDDSLYQPVVVEALAPFAYHEKTMDSALAFAEYMTGRTDLSVIGTELIVPDLFH